MEKGYVSEVFEEKVLERENKTPTSIGSQIAIPHVFKDCVKKTAIAAVRLKYPVLWCGEDKVKIIIIYVFSPFCSDTTRANPAITNWPSL